MSDEVLGSRVDAEKKRLDALELVQPLVMTMARLEKAEIERVIDLCQGNYQQAALRLGIARVTLYRKMGRMQ